VIAIFIFMLLGTSCFVIDVIQTKYKHDHDTDRDIGVRWENLGLIIMSSYANIGVVTSYCIIYLKIKKCYFNCSQ
jgi:hypothetical protein